MIHDLQLKLELQCLPKYQKYLISNSDEILQSNILILTLMYHR